MDSSGAVAGVTGGGLGGGVTRAFAAVGAAVVVSYAAAPNRPPEWLTTLPPEAGALSRLSATSPSPAVARA
jgi:hypothetical protein